jgi:glycosyltransferase involved in cell wall biosynthesis
LQVVFVGTQFWLKGGFELCDAFASVAPDYPHVRLTVISNVDPDVRAHFADTPIEFVAARLPRSEIADILATADLFAMPTLVESFGMAALEALAHGLPILTTCVYALPELVQDGVNGVLLSDSFGYWRGVEANPEIWRAPDLEECVRGRRFPALRDELTAALGRMLANREALRAMGGASRSLFDTRFAPEVRQRRFRAALEKFAARAGER